MVNLIDVILIEGILDLQSWGGETVGTLRASYFNYRHAYNWYWIWDLALFNRKQKALLLSYSSPLASVNVSRSGKAFVNLTQYCIGEKGITFFLLNGTKCTNLFFFPWL